MFIAGYTSMARNPTKTFEAFYKHRGKIATLGFSELKGD